MINLQHKDSYLLKDNLVDRAMSSSSGSPPRKRQRSSSPLAASFSSFSSSSPHINIDIDTLATSTPAGSVHSGQSGHQQYDSYSLSSLSSVQDYGELGQSPSYSPTGSFGSPLSSVHGTPAGSWSAQSGYSLSSQSSPALSQAYSLGSLSNVQDFGELGQSPSYSPTGSVGSPLPSGYTQSSNASSQNPSAQQFSLQTLRNIDVLGLDFSADTGQVARSVGSSVSTGQPSFASLSYHSSSPGRSGTGSVSSTHSSLSSSLNIMSNEVKTYYQQRMDEFAYNTQIDSTDMVNVYEMFQTNSYAFRPISLGEGTFSIVYKAVQCNTMMSRTPVERAIKVTKCDPQSSDQLAYDRECKCHL